MSHPVQQPGPPHQPRPQSAPGWQNDPSRDALQALLRRDQLRNPSGATALMCLGLVTSVLMLYFSYQFDAAMRREDMFSALAEGRVTGGFGLLWFPQFLPVFAAVAGFIAFPLRRSAPLIGGAVLTFLAVISSVSAIVIGNRELASPSLFLAIVGVAHLGAFVAAAFLSRRHQA